MILQTPSGVEDNMMFTLDLHRYAAVLVAQRRLINALHSLDQTVSWSLVLSDGAFGLQPFSSLPEASEPLNKT